jgi:hypothetical protein
MINLVGSLAERELAQGPAPELVTLLAGYAVYSSMLRRELVERGCATVRAKGRSGCTLTAAVKREGDRFVLELGGERVPLGADAEGAAREAVRVLDRKLGEDIVEFRILS